MVEISDICVRDILPNTYFVDEDGNVFSTLSNRYMIPTIANTGYKVLNFKTTTGKSRVQQVHRIVMLTFSNNPLEHTNDQVNHIDGNKLNNSIDNFEWINNVGNNEHAQEIGLLKSGELCEWSKLTEEQVREICQHLVDKDFGTLENLSKLYNVSITTIGDIARRISWKQVSRDYDFDYYIRSKFTDEQVHFMCQVFSIYKSQSFSYCYYYIIFNLGLSDTKSVRTRILSIYKKDKNNFIHITSQYDY